MQVIKFLLLLVLVHFVVSEISTGVQPLTNDDVAKYEKLIASIKTSNGLFKNIEDAHNSIAALFKFNIKPSNVAALCDSLKSDLSSSEVKKLHLAHTTALRLGCDVPAATFTAVDSAIKNSITEQAELDVVYHAVRALLFLRKQLPASKDSQLLKTAFSAVLSRYNKDTGAFCSGAVTQSCLKATGQAYETVGMLISLIGIVGDVSDDVIAKAVAVSKQAPAIIKQALGSGSISESSALVRGLNRLAEVVPVDKKSLKHDIEEIAEFLLTKKQSGVSTAADLYDLAEGLATIARSSLATPYVVSEIAAKDNTFSVSVSNVLGKLPAGSKLTLKKAAPGNNENKAIISNANFAVDNSDNTKFTYTYADVKDKLKSGVFKLTLEVTPGENKDGLSSDTFVRVVKFETGITVRNAMLSVMHNQVVDTSYTPTFPSAVEESVALSASNTVRLSFALVESDSKKGARAPQQVFTRLFNKAQPDEEYFFIAKRTDDDRGSYSVDIAMNKLSGILPASSSSVFSLQLLVGDAGLSAPIQWTVASALNLDTVPKKVLKDDDESFLYKPRPVVAHAFRQPDVRGSKVKSTLFTVLVLAIPYIVLLLGLARVGLSVHIPDGLTVIQTLILQGCVLAMLGVIVLYWLEITIFQAFAYFTILGVVALFVGEKALTNIHASQAQSKKTKQD